MKLLTQGNTKTGKGIKLFNLPRKITCPCSSTVCDRVCYATWFNRFGNIQLQYQQRLKATKEADFVEKICSEISSKTPIIRWHTSGDFYSVDYINKWIEICERNPSTKFYGYTRSWNSEELWPAVKRLASLQNVQLAWSCDKSMPVPPEGWRAYLSIDDSDIPNYEVGIIFRDNRKTIKKELGGMPVCPHETGEYTIKDNPLKCLTCGICFSSIG